MKIFLSSTYLDLIEHRKAVVSALHKMGEEVEHMEIFGARDEEPTQASLEQLDLCDSLVGIYAYRYGTIPTDSKLSVTEQEYLHAVDKKIPVLVFVVDESHLWLPKLMDKNLKRVNSFKIKVTKEHTPEYFTSPDNLAANVVSSVSRLAKKKAPDSLRISLSSPSYSPPKPTGSTLPTQPYFFGRAKELDIIKSALSPESRTWGALIDGPGGIGKTALAIRAAIKAEGFEHKIFITAKVRELTAEGEKKLTDFTRLTYLAMLDELGRELGIEGLEKLPPDDRPNELRLALTGKKALIIFDNLETLPEDERMRLFHFLSRLPEGNKAIVTSRRRTDVDARIVRLDRLAKGEALGLIAELAQKYPRLEQESQKEYEDLYEMTQGNPLFIRWIAGQLGREGSKCRTIAEACDFIDKAPKGNDPLEYIFGDLLETFSNDETKVLAALTYFNLPAKPRWIADMTDLPERAVETALEDLTDRSILTADPSARTYFLPPLTAKFIRTRRPEVVNQTGDSLVNRTYALVMQYGGYDNYEGFRILDAEWDFISAALPRLLTGDNQRLQTVCYGLELFLNFTGRWDDSLWINERAEERALAANDKKAAGWRAYNAGHLYTLRGQATEVLACATRAAENFVGSTPSDIAAAIQLRGNGLLMNKDFPAAIDTLHEALDIHRSVSPESNNVAILLSDIANAEKSIKDYHAAERDTRESLRIAKINQDNAGTAYRIGYLADLAIDREQWKEAESLAQDALAIEEKIGRQELIARDCYRIAKALLKQGCKLDKALSHCIRAVEIMTRLRYSELPEVKETLAEIEQALKKSPIIPIS